MYWVSERQLDAKTPELPAKIWIGEKYLGKRVRKQERYFKIGALRLTQ
jgi:hypothetical protein